MLPICNQKHYQPRFFTNNRKGGTDQSSSNPASSNVNTCIHIRAVPRECRGRLFVLIGMNVYLHPLSN